VDVRHIKLMASLILTTDCQRNCDYCFAAPARKTKSKISWDGFIKATDFIATGDKSINIIGGEPTVHDKFIDMLEYLIVNDFYIQVFTNGMLDNSTIKNLDTLLKRVALREEQLYFSININEEKYQTKDENYLQNRFIDKFRKLIYPSFTIHDKNTNLLFLKEIIYNKHLLNEIRLGLALPIFGYNNKHLSIDCYRDVATNIIELSNNVDDTIIHLDCGFPLCMFTLEEIGELNSNPNNDFSFICGQPLDIYPDLTISNCFPLSLLHKTYIHNFKTMIEAYKYFASGFITPIGIYGDKCRECTFFNKVCFGGCKGFYKPKGDDDYEKNKVEG